MPAPAPHAEKEPRAENADWCQKPVSAPFGKFGTGGGFGTSWRERLRARLGQPGNPADALPPVASPVVEIEPVAPCPACGTGSFHRAPGDRWRCSMCAPPALAANLTGWSFCGVPGGQARELPPLPMPPAAPAPPVYLDHLLPDRHTAPLGKCRRCRFTAPLMTEGRCGACVAEQAGIAPRATRQMYLLSPEARPWPPT
jgi:hypothetical protein